jgi:hypothetical protein
MAKVLIVKDWRWSQFLYLSLMKFKDETFYKKYGLPTLYYECRADFNGK